ncbi:MAG: hypothetical protein IPH62_16035 [Ignavibacteriae bacterium]|nr:hypothetical protein [Ignavibacteriota bacterium]
MLISKIDKNDLAHLKFSKDEIKTKLYWEHSKEFEYNGIMYDVVESINLHDSVEYICWQDDEETELNKRFINLLTSSLEKNNSESKIFHNLTSFNSNYYLIQIFNPNILQTQTDNYKYYQYKQNYLNIYNSPNSPPPKV